MKDVEEALYCMGQMADKCLTSLGAIQKNYKEFASLVKRMREAQNNSPYKYLTYCNNIEELRRLESEVDEYLKKIND